MRSMLPPLRLCHGPPILKPQPIVKPRTKPCCSLLATRRENAPCRWHSGTTPGVQAPRCSYRFDGDCDCVVIGNCGPIGVGSRDDFGGGAFKGA
jgi:hypothetical protein